MYLKDYQAKLLDDYADYLRRCVELGSGKAAYQESVKAWRDLPFEPHYYPLPGAEEVPYVCLRVPTGGGKTFLAAHAIEMVNEHYLPADTTLTLWLVPSDAIRTQTLRILKNREHPLTQSLRRAIGSIAVLDVAESLYVTPPTLDTNHTIIVATMQSFKREDSSGLRVRKENGHLMDHFSRVKDADKVGKHSLQDVLRLRRPFVIVDEAHNQGTTLALDTIADFKPCAVLELTATPDRNHSPSNVLRSVSASVLQAENMLKLPLELAVHADWKIILRDAVNRRTQLEKDAVEEEKETGEYIRPVLFIQAEKNLKNQENMTPERVKEALIKDFNFQENDIAISTGKVEEIGERQMDDPDFPRVIITVDKLREGWDCPYAYVMMTFRNTTSKTAVEQVVGRVLRMPHVKRKKRESLNRAYCYACSSEFSEVVRSLKDGLVQSGFERMESSELIVMPDSGRADDEDMFDQREDVAISLPVVDGEIKVPDLTGFSQTMLKSVELDPEAGTLTLVGKPTPAFKKKIIAAVEKSAGSDEAQKFKLEMDQELETRNHRRPATDYPSRRGETFSIPLLMHRQDNFLDSFEETTLLDGEWTLSDDFDPVLTDDEFNTSPEQMKKFRFEMQSGQVRYNYYEEQERELLLHHKEEGWDLLSLTQWLDWNTDFHYASQPDKVAWLRRMLEELESKGLSIEELAYRKFRLREAVRNKLKSGLVTIKQRRFDDLFTHENAFEVPGGEHTLTFSEGHYGYNYAYSGRYAFQKHFFPQIGDLKAKGEEFDCACRIDQHPNVEWWVRNVEKQPNSFWLQTSRGRFFPDFVIKLKSGKIIALEYKGKHLITDSKEKDDIGKLWARRSGGHCDFKMLADKDWKQLDALS